MPVLLDFQSANANPPTLSRWLFSNCMGWQGQGQQEKDNLELKILSEHHPGR